MRGKVVDKGIGPSSVYVSLFQVRGTKSYYYNGKRWVKGKRTAANVLKSWRAVKPTSSGAWSLKVKGLTKGTLIISYRAFDRESNMSAVKVRKQRLTR